MATIKSFTSLEQSKKLAEILHLETADMFHFIHEVDTVGFGYKKEAAEFYSKTEFKYLPCWSLSALLGVLPNGIVMFKDSQNGKYHSSSMYVGTYVTADNPIDACVAMIEKLNELGML